MKRFTLLATAVTLVLMIAMPAIAAGKKVLFIDSYHEGYAWSDGVYNGIKSGLDGKGVELQIVRMDTKRNKEEDFKQAAALKAKSVIESFAPDVVIASDDNAAKYLIEPFYKDAKLPFVFCGLNWDASVYGMPYSNVTGMVEVAPVAELLEQLKQYTPGTKVGFLAADELTTHKEADNYKNVLGIDTVRYFATDMEDWKKGLVKLQQEDKVDVLILENTTGMPGWDAAAAAEFVAANTKVPSGTALEHMTPFAMLGFTKIPEEQGFYAAGTALRIIEGTSPKDIPVVKNTDGKLFANLKIARAIGIELPFEILGSASAVIE